MLESRPLSCPYGLRGPPKGPYEGKKWPKMGQNKLKSKTSENEPLLESNLICHPGHRN